MAFWLAPALLRTVVRQHQGCSRAVFHATLRRMANNGWSSSSWSFLRRLEERSATLATNEDRADALVRSGELVPHRALWRLWPMLLILTIAGVAPSARQQRIDISNRARRFLDPDELLTLSVQLLRSGRGPGYLRTILLGAPGGCWSRLRYPLEFTCGQVLDRPREEGSRLLALRTSDAVRSRSEAATPVQRVQDEVATQEARAAWRQVRAVLSHPDCTDAIRAELRSRLGASLVG